MTIKELKQELSQYNDEDIVRLSSCDDEGNEVDLFDFYIDEIRDCEFINGDKFTEVRICQLPHEGKKYARKCDKCGNGMNEGYVVSGGEEYYCTPECLHKVYTPKEWQEMYHKSEKNWDGFEDYWTEWEDEYQYQMINGILVEID
jgi:hypothetical protein